MYVYTRLWALMTVCGLFSLAYCDFAQIPYRNNALKKVRVETVPAPNRFVDDFLPVIALL